MGARIHLVIGFVLGAHFPGTALAEPCTRAHTLQQGEASPCDGDLLPVAVTEKLLNSHTALELAKKQLRDARAEAADTLSACSANLDTERLLRQECEAGKTVVSTCRDKSISEEPWFVAAVAVAVTAALILGAQQLAR